MVSSIVRPNRWQRLVWGGCLLAGFGLGNLAQAEESPLLEHVDRKMIDIGNQLANAKRRLAMSSGVVQENPNGESGMGLTCCTDNLRTIAQKLQIIRGSIERMALYYSEQQNGEAIGILGELDTRLMAIATGAAIFGRAPDEKHAASALTGFIRPWNEFRNGVQALRLCCPIPIPVEPEPTESAAPDEGDNGKKSKKGKKKKDKKKKAKDDSSDGDEPGA